MILSNPVLPDEILKGTRFHLIDLIFNDINFVLKAECIGF